MDTKKISWKNLVKSFWIIFGIYITAAMMACGKNDNNANNPPPPGVPTSPIAPCPIGFQQNGNMCYNPITGQQVPVTTVGGLSNKVQYAAANFGQNNLTITDMGAYKSVLRDAMGVCDRYTYTSGSSSCDSWATGFASVMIEDLGGNNMAFTLTHFGPKSGSFFNISFGFDTSGLVFDPLTLKMAVSLINASVGFEARGYGPLGSAAVTNLFQFQVASGKLGDPSFSYQIAYAGKVFAKGTMSRCSSLNCTNW